MNSHSESVIKNLIFDLHRCIETRDWDSARAFLADATLEEKLSSKYGPREVPQRFIGSEMKVSIENEGAANAIVMILKVGGTDSPKIMVNGIEWLIFTRHGNDGWKVNSYDVQVDVEMFEDWGAGIF